MLHQLTHTLHSFSRGLHLHPGALLLQPSDAFPIFSQSSGAVQTSGSQATLTSSFTVLDDPFETHHFMDEEGLRADKVCCMNALMCNSTTPFPCRPLQPARPAIVFETGL